MSTSSELNCASRARSPGSKTPGDPEPSMTNKCWSSRAQNKIPLQRRTQLREEESEKCRTTLRESPSHCLTIVDLRHSDGLRELLELVTLWDLDGFDVSAAQQEDPHSVDELNLRRLHVKEEEQLELVAAGSQETTINIRIWSTKRCRTLSDKKKTLKTSARRLPIQLQIKKFRPSHPPPQP